MDQGRFDKTNGKQPEVLQTIARKHDKTVPQVILRWLANHGPVVPIVRTTKLAHLDQNIESLDFDLDGTDIEDIRKAYPVNIIEVPTDRIRPSPTGEWGHTVYMTVEEALSNEAGFTPSPAELADNVKSGGVLKPVRLVPSITDEYDYDLIAGRIRFWAWVMKKFEGLIILIGRSSVGDDCSPWKEVQVLQILITYRLSNGPRSVI